MKICFLNHDLSDKTGAGRFGLSLLNAMKKMVLDIQYRILTHDNFLPKNKFCLILALPKIRRIFQKYDVIHALDGWPYGVIAAIASLGLKKKVIITAIGTGAVQPLYQPFKKWLMKWAYRKANIVTAVSNNTKREIQKFLPDLKIEVINHGVNFDKFQVSSFKFQEIEKLKPYILSVGVLKKRKGYEYSLSAFAEIALKFPDLKYVIVGDGPERDKLNVQCQMLNIADKVVFLKNLSETELVTLYKNAELFILLSQDVNKDIEGFGLVFLEAAAAGLPVIASKGTSAEDAVLDDQNGFLVSPQNYQAAAAAMETILNNADLKKSFAAASLNFAQKMSWDAAAQKYLGLYGRDAG